MMDWFPIDALPVILLAAALVFIPLAGDPP